MILEVEHQLRYAAKVVQCGHGHTVATHSTDHGFCTCGWEIWSRDGRAEILELHTAHLEFVRKKEHQHRATIGEQRAACHTIAWNETLDFARCTFCEWQCEGSNMAKTIVAFESHRERIRNATL